MEKVAATYTGKYAEDELLNQINLSAGLAATYLLGMQNKDGYWYDYRLPVGVSDEWVTGFVGRSLQAWVPEHSSLFKAAGALLDQRLYQAGWGYNKHTGADADSTANVILFLKSLEVTVPAADQEFLLAHQQQDGGFSTYLDNQGWSCSHPDVTPMVFMALSGAFQKLCADNVKRYLTDNCEKGCLWSAYWWRNCFYSCFHNSRLMMEYLGVDIVKPISMLQKGDFINHKEPFQVASAFDLAWLCGLYWLFVKETGNEVLRTIAITLTQELIDQQQ
ncbi:MAG: hypothetical protein MI867_10130, partial [Pseudomonadales bacterium]|nr:hypothetical protein [Pseudomonadales bacterium]